MFHAPTTESKQQNNPSRSQSTPERTRELSSRVPASMGPVSSSASAPPPPTPGRRHPLAHLHSVYGNQAVLRMLSRAPCSLQTKLTVNQPGDQYEQEADRVANQVMRMTATSVQGTSVSLSESGVQRACACGGSGKECPECSKKEEMSLQRAANASSGGFQAPPIVHDVLRSPGQPLDAGTRAFFEPRFGHDFSGVRVHTDGRAAQSAQAVNARAYTVGHHLVFDRGSYDPGSSAGKHLLAHELTHSVQQGAVLRRETTGPSSAKTPVIGSATPQISRQPAEMVQRAVTKGCIAPSFVVSPPIASLFGTVAETIIEPDYISKMGGTPFGDVFLDNPMGPMAYVAFLVAHHPSLNTALLAAQIGISGGVLVPDILDTRSVAGGAPEYYEIKPDSPDGRALGRGKLAAIDAFMSFNSLPYVRGTSYVPTPSFPMPISSALLGGALGLPIVLSCGLPKVTLEPTRTDPALILYQVCVEADFDCYLKVISLEALLALIIILILIARGLPIPIPAPAVAMGGSGLPPGSQPAATGESPAAQAPAAAGSTTAQQPA